MEVEAERGDIVTGHRVSLELVGFDQHEGSVPLPVFLSELQQLESAIKAADEAVSGRRRATSARVVDLHHGSPATVVVELVPREGARDVCEQVLDVLRSATFVGGDLSAVPGAVLQAVREMASPVGRRISAASLTVAGTTLQLTQALTTMIDGVLARTEAEVGTIVGKLDVINVHGSNRKLTIYPAVGPTKVVCIFPEQLQAEAAAAIGRRVEVRGILKYRARAKYPHEMQVESLEVLPLPEDLPGFEDMHGMAPKATGELSAEGHVRKARDEWD